MEFAPKLLPGPLNRVQSVLNILYEASLYNGMDGWVSSKLSRPTLVGNHAMLEVNHSILGSAHCCWLLRGKKTAQEAVSWSNRMLTSRHPSAAGGVRNK
eukprot:352795-Chlamydomonas_euryale.AAC.3